MGTRQGGGWAPGRRKREAAAAAARTYIIGARLFGAAPRRPAGPAGPRCCPARTALTRPHSRRGGGAGHRKEVHACRLHVASPRHAGHARPPYCSLPFIHAFQSILFMRYFLRCVPRIAPTHPHLHTPTPTPANPHQAPHASPCGAAKFKSSVLLLLIHHAGRPHA